MLQTKTLQLNLRNKVNLFFTTMLVVAMSATIAFAGEAGAWKKQDFNVKGTWTLENKADGQYITLSDEFKTKSAPDLKLFLSKNNYSGITGTNATNNAVQVAVLKSAKGGQSYKIPAGIDVSAYQSLVLHCEQYSKLWASTPLK